MKEKYSHELNFVERLFGVWRVNKDSYDTKWGYFAPRFGFEIILNRGGYFDQRYSIQFCFVFGVFHIHLPIKTSIPESCETPRYGIAIHNNTFWIYLGGEMDEGWNQVQQKWIAWDLPFFSYVFDFHKVMNKNGEWVKYDSDNNQAATETYNYTYKLNNGEIQNRKAECYREKRQWHRKWFPFIKLVRENIDVSFSDEVGERSGTWKGGTVGCSYDLLPDESIESCLIRMEKERDF